MIIYNKCLEFFYYLYDIYVYFKVLWLGFDFLRINYNCQNKKKFICIFIIDKQLFCILKIIFFFYLIIGYLYLEFGKIQLIILQVIVL